MVEREDGWVVLDLGLPTSLSFVVVIHLSIIDIGTLVRYENQIESYMKNEEINELTAKLQLQSRFE